MTPKEKAEELVNKFLNANKGHFYQDSEIEDLEAAKECALIAADELMQKTFWDKSERRFWKEVKEEIEKT